MTQVVVASNFYLYFPGRKNTCFDCVSSDTMNRLFNTLANSKPITARVDVSPRSPSKRKVDADSPVPPPKRARETAEPKPSKFTSTLHNIKTVATPCTKKDANIAVAAKPKPVQIAHRAKPKAKKDVSSPFTEKYRPQDMNSLIGNKAAIRKLDYWLKHRQSGKPAVLIAGPPGVGKTTAAIVMLQAHKYKYYEINASETRTGPSLIHLMKCRNHYCSGEGSDRKPFALIVDEVDGIYSNQDTEQDETIDCLVEFVKKDIKVDFPPVIFICNDRWTKSMRKLADVCEYIPFYPLSQNELKSIYERVIFQEHIKRLSHSLEQNYLMQSSGDARKLLNDMELYARDHCKPDHDQSSKQRGMFEICACLFRKHEQPLSMDQLSQIYDSSENSLLMLHENYCRVDTSVMFKTNKPTLDQIEQLDNQSQFLDTLSELDMWRNRDLQSDILPLSAVCFADRTPQSTQPSPNPRRQQYSFPSSLVQWKKQREKRNALATLHRHQDESPFHPYEYDNPTTQHLADQIVAAGNAVKSGIDVDDATHFLRPAKLDDSFLESHPRFSVSQSITHSYYIVTADELDIHPDCIPVMIFRNYRQHNLDVQPFPPDDKKQKLADQVTEAGHTVRKCDRTHATHLLLPLDTHPDLSDTHPVFSVTWHTNEYYYVMTDRSLTSDCQPVIICQDDKHPNLMLERMTNMDWNHFNDSLVNLQKHDLLLRYLEHWQDTENAADSSVDFAYHGHVDDSGQIVNYSFTPLDPMVIDQLTELLKKRVNPDLLVQLFSCYDQKLSSSFLHKVESKLRPIKTDSPKPASKSTKSTRQNTIAGLQAALQQQRQQSPQTAPSTLSLPSSADEECPSTTSV